MCGHPALWDADTVPSACPVGGGEAPWVSPGECFLEERLAPQQARGPRSDVIALLRD